MTRANKLDTTSPTSRCAWTCRARRFSETCKRLCPLECRDGASMSEHCHQRRTRQLCRLPLQATSPVAAAANDTRLAQGETLGNLRSCKCHRRAAFAHGIRDISAASAAANQDCHGSIRRRGSAGGWMIKPFLAQGCGAARLRKGKRGGAMAHLSVERYRVASSLNVSITRRAPGPCIHSISQEMADSWLRNLTKL